MGAKRRLILRWIKLRKTKCRWFMRTEWFLDVVPMYSEQCSRAIWKKGSALAYPLTVILVWPAIIAWALPWVICTPMNATSARQMCPSCSWSRTCTVSRASSEHASGPSRCLWLLRTSEISSSSARMQIRSSSSATAASIWRTASWQKSRGCYRIPTATVAKAQNKWRGNPEPF